MKKDRASRFQAVIVPCTCQSERSKLEQTLRDGDITAEEFDLLLSKLKNIYGVNSSQAKSGN